MALGPSATGKTHIALGLGLAACQKGLPVAFVTASALDNELMEARDEKHLLRRQRQLAKVKRLIIPSRRLQAISCRAVECRSAKPVPNACSSGSHNATSRAPL